MPRPVPVSHAAPVYPGEPSLAWTPRLDEFMWVDRFDVLHPPAHVPLPPIGVDFNGIVKADFEGLDERVQRAHYLEVFEQILDVLADGGTRHREHPTFEIGGHVDHGAFFLDGKRAMPDHLIPQCAVKFQIWLEGS